MRPVTWDPESEVDLDLGNAVDPQGLEGTHWTLLEPDDVVVHHRMAQRHELFPVFWQFLGVVSLGGCYVGIKGRLGVAEPVVAMEIF